jgi:hypothetical protein
MSYQAYRRFTASLQDICFVKLHSDRPRYYGEFSRQRNREANLSLMGRPGLTGGVSDSSPMAASKK